MRSAWHNPRTHTVRPSCTQRKRLAEKARVRSSKKAHVDDDGKGGDDGGDADNDEDDDDAKIAAALDSDSKGEASAPGNVSATAGQAPSRAVLGMAAAEVEQELQAELEANRPVQPQTRVSVCAARTLNAKG